MERAVAEGDTEAKLAPAMKRDLRAVARDAEGRELGSERMPNGMVQWLGDMPEGVSYDAVTTVEATGTFTPRESGAHAFGTRGLGGFRLVVAGTVLFDWRGWTPTDRAVLETVVRSLGLALEGARGVAQLAE